MGVYINESQLVVIEIKAFHFHFDLLKDVDKDLKHEIDSIITF